MCLVGQNFTHPTILRYTALDKMWPNTAVFVFVGRGELPGSVWCGVILWISEVPLMSMLASQYLYATTRLAPGHLSQWRHLENTWPNCQVSVKHGGFILTPA